VSLLQKFKDKRILHISHEDLDGITSTVIGLFYVAPISFSFITHNSKYYNGDDLDRIILNDIDVVIFTDFSPTKEFYLELKELKKEIFIFDHHVSSYEEIKDVVTENHYYDVTKCGASLFFEILTKGQRVKKVAYELVNLCETYDLYQTESTLWRQAKGLSNLLYETVNWKLNYTSTKAYENFINSMLYKLESASQFYFTSEEQSLVLKAEQKERKMIEDAKKSLKIRVDKNNNVYGYFECSSKVSYVANCILKERTNLSYIIGHSTYLETAKKELNGKISLRSIGDFDVSQIAVLWGCGGHKNASGVELSLEYFSKLKKGELHLN